MNQDILKILDYNNAEGLLLVTQKDDEISETERKILYLAADDYLADAVFFQQSENHKSIPQFFIYDNTNNEKFKDIELAEIHKRLWSSEIVPLYFVFEKAEIKIFNAKKKLDIDKNGEENINPTDVLIIAKKIEKEFEKKKLIYSPFLFQNGSFWETDYCLKNYLKASITTESPFEILIKNLHELKKELTDNKILPEIANRIVIFCILIKYLEEKKDEKGNSVFTIEGNIFMKKWNVDNFSVLIKNGEFIELLNYLSEKFNGKIFERTEDEENKIKSLSQNILNHLSNFVNANYRTKNQQLYLWRLYSFRYLPVELISRIYEEFILNTKGVVYTPPFLVDFLIDECMPLDNYENFSNGKYKIIDPACGSGIFCVSAYQRLIDWHIINEYKKSGKRKKWNKELEIETLKKILRENIFGVDVQQQAVQIAVFSLTLAMLEKLTPIQLWHDLDFEDRNDKGDKKFEDLKEKNIIHNNFFEYLGTAENDFDLVIGNPPFIRQNFDELKKDYKLIFPSNIPKNLAVLFLDQSINLLKDGGLQCLILPSGAILYNDEAMNYRKVFLQNYHVPQIVDFTHLRRKLFNKDVATCAFFTKKQIPTKESQTLHIISSNSAKEENKIYFCFDTYDFHFVPLDIALKQKYIWKANLIGGGRLKWIANRLSKIKPTIKEFLKEKEEKQDWIFRRGYFIGNKKNSADYITGNYYIPEKAFTDKGIDYSQIEVETEKRFKDISNKKAFTIPQILIKRGISNNGLIPIELIDYSEVIKSTKTGTDFNNILCFRQGIFGIHFNENDENSANHFLNYFEKVEINRLFSLLVYLSSGALLVSKESSLKKNDIENLPYLQTEDEKINLQLSEVEKIWQEDVFNFYIHQAKASSKNPLNKELFSDGLNTKDEKFIRDYANTFTWLMNINYTAVKEKSFKTTRITITKSYIAVEFHYCAESIETEIENKSDEEYQSHFEKTTGNKKIARIVEFIDYANNKIYYIKPRQKRYWLKSIADRDNMSCFADFGNSII